VRRTDSSLLDEWERLRNPLDETGTDVPGGVDDDTPPPITANPRAFRALVRGAMFRRVELVARERYGALAALGDLDPAGLPWDADRWAAALDPYYDVHDEILTGSPARGPALFQVTERRATWELRQQFDDPDGDHDWRIDAVIDLVESDAAGEVVLRIAAVGAL
jgi:hypothetical protein